MKKIINLFVMVALLMTGCRNNHEYVDLGLPSDTLWATCNVGATTPEGYGDYFAWGETKPKSIFIYYWTFLYEWTTYDWSTYKYDKYDTEKLTKYCDKSDYGNNGFPDNLTVIQSGDDAATSNWGSGWCMPTKEQWEELLENTRDEWTTQNGVQGRLFTSKKNGQSLFLPAAGDRWDVELDDVGSSGYYWSSSLYTDYPDYAWSSASVRTAATWASTTATTVDLSEQCVLRVRTNLCSVTGKTGKAQEQSDGALAEQAIQPRTVAPERMWRQHVCGSYSCRWRRFFGAVIYIPNTKILAEMIVT